MFARECNKCKARADLYDDGHMTASCAVARAMRSRSNRHVTARGRYLQVYDWQAIVEKHGPAVWQTAYRLLGNHSDAADCFQETFLAALELSRRQRVRSVCGLLVRLATIRAIDTLRDRTRQRRRETAGAAGQQQRDNKGDPASRAQRRELAWQLREAIGRLPPQEGKAFCLRYLSDMSYKEIANELHTSTNAAGVLLHRAKAKLRQALTPAQTQEAEVSR